MIFPSVDKMLKEVIKNNRRNFKDEKMILNHGYKPQGKPGTLIPPRGAGIISMLMQDNSICKCQRTAFLKLGFYYPPLIAGSFDKQISMHVFFEIGVSQ